MAALESAFLSIKNEKQMGMFLRDLLTPSEIKEFRKRWAIAQNLFPDKKDYRKIAKKFKASVATVTRVARFLKDEPYQGYSSVLNSKNND